MNNVPMKLDYSKTLNEQLDTFNYYKDRYASYELEIIKLQQEIEQLKANLEEANDNATWWRNRFNAIHRQLYKTNDDAVNSLEDEDE